MSAAVVDLSQRCASADAAMHESINVAHQTRSNSFAVS
jgi:hypothetical protein